MKKLILVLLITSISLSLFSQWQQLVFPQGFQRVIFFNDSSGYMQKVVGVSGSSGQQCYQKIKNYGETYTDYQCEYFQYYGSSEFYKETFFSFDTIFYIRYPPGGKALYKTYNGFFNGTYVASFSHADYYSINSNFFLTPHLGFIIGNAYSNHSLFKYFDDSLETVYSDSLYFYNVLFSNADVGFLVQNDTNNYKKMMRTLDGGDTWSVCLDSIQSSLQEFEAVNDSVIYFLLGNKQICKTNDYGATWNYLQIDTSLYRFSAAKIEFAGDGLIYMQDYTDRIMKTYNDGLSFVYDSLTVSNIMQIDMFSDTLGYVSTYNGKLFRKPYRCITTSSNITETICDLNSYTSPSGNYIWTSSGTYTDIILNSEACDSVITIDLLFGQTPYVNLGNDITITDNQTVIIGGGNNLSNYLWNTGETTPQIVVIGDSLGVGTYEYWLYSEDTNGCSNSDTIVITVTSNINVDEINNAYNISIFPNPTTGKIKIQAEGVESIEVYNLQGQIICKKSEVGRLISELDLSKEPKGIYIIKVTTSKGVAVEKVVLD